MRGLNEIEALQRAWSRPDRSLSWVCDFIHEGRIRLPQPEPHQSPAACQENRPIERKVSTEVAWRSRVAASLIAWCVATLSVVCARLLNRGDDND
jgi:hypothetical protein